MEKGLEEIIQLTQTSILSTTEENDDQHTSDNKEVANLEVNMCIFRVKLSAVSLI